MKKRNNFCRAPPYGILADTAKYGLQKQHQTPRHENRERLKTNGKKNRRTEGCTKKRMLFGACPDLFELWRLVFIRRACLPEALGRND